MLAWRWRGRSLRDRLWRLCLRVSPCMLLAYNLAPLAVGFMGGLVGALLPLVAVSLAAPQALQSAVVVLSNVAAGASAGIAAAAARRPARILVDGVDIVRVGDSVRVDVLAVNDSSVTCRDVSLYVSGFRQQGFEWLATMVQDGGSPTLYLLTMDGSQCCSCRGCVVEGVEPTRYRVKTVARAPRQGVRVRGVHASIMPPRSILEAPLLELEVLDMTGCVGAWGDCSSVRRCGFLRKILEARGVALARIVSGGEAIAVLATPVRDAHDATLEFAIEAVGDPAPRVVEEVGVDLSLEAVDDGWFVRVAASVAGSTLERWFHINPLRCTLANGGSILDATRRSRAH